MAIWHLYRHPDDVRKEFIVLDFQNRKSLRHVQWDFQRLQKIPTVDTGAEIPVYGDPDVAGLVQKCFPVVCDDGFWFQ